MIADSVQYYAAATALAAHGTLAVPIAFSAHEQFDAAGRLLTSHPFVLWPPGYPIALAFVSRLLAVPIFSSADRLRQGYGGPPKLQAAAEALRDTDIATSAAIVNLLALSVTLLAVAWLVDRAAGPVTALSVATLFGVLPVVQDVFRMGLSEGLFVALCALSLVALTWWMEDPARHTLAPWGAALAIGAAMHVRYTGVFLVPVHVACALCPSRLSRAVQPLRPIPLFQPFVALPPLLPRGPTAGLRVSLVSTHHAGLHVLRKSPAVNAVVRAERPGPRDGAGEIPARRIRPRSRSAGCRRVPGSAGGHLPLATSRSRRRTSSHLEGLYVAGTCALVYLVGMLALRTVVEFDSLIRASSRQRRLSPSSSG